MSNLQDSAKTVLAAVTALSTAFTGGIVTYADLEEAGLTRTSYPAAFDSDLRLKPILILKERTGVTTGAVKDENAQRTSMVQALEVWYYSASNGSYAALESARATVYGKFHDRAVGGKRLARRDIYTMQRDRALDNAAVIYDVYDAYGTTTT